LAIAVTQNSHVKNHVNAETTITKQLNIVIGKNDIRCSLTSDNMQSRLEFRMIPPNLTEIIGVPCSHLKTTAATTAVFFWQFFGYSQIFPAAFRLLLKIFSWAAKFGCLDLEV